MILFLIGVILGLYLAHIMKTSNNLPRLVSTITESYEDGFRKGLKEGIEIGRDANPCISPACDHSPCDLN